MARFETTGQIVGLFFCAALVSLAVIAFLKAEARERYGLDEEDEDIAQPGSLVGEKKDSVKREVVSGDEPQASRVSFLSEMYKVKVQIRRFLHLDRQDIVQESKIRRKRSLLSLANQEMEKEPNPELSNSLLSATLSNHQIRNIDEKVDKLKESDQMVQAVLKQFCLPKVEAEKLELTQRLESKFQADLEEAKKNMELSYKEELRVAEERFQARPSEDSKQPDNNDINSDSGEAASSFVHPIPPISSHDDSSIDEEQQAYYVANLAGKQTLAGNKPEIVCQSYGELLVTVAITTVVNVVFFGMILICRSLALNCDAKIANDEGYHPFSIDSSEEDFGTDRIIKKKLVVGNQIQI